MPPRPGDIVELDITTLAYGGQGVARLDEFVVFVRGAVPGDRVRVKLVHTDVALGFIDFARDK